MRFFEADPSTYQPVLNKVPAWSAQEHGPIIRPPKIPSGDSVQLDYDVFKGCSETDSGKVRIGLARTYFDQVTPSNLDLVVEVYKKWVFQTEYMLMQAVRVRTGETRYFAVKCAKRGNDVYMDRVEQRLSFLRGVKGGQWLWVTLTYDSKRCSLHNAWVNIGAEFNKWITKIRQQYGRVWYASFPEAFSGSGKARGYPHYHILMLFEDHVFKTFKQFSEVNGVGSLTTRIKDKSEFKKWHSFVDVKVLSTATHAYKYAKNHLSAHMAENWVSNGVMWFYRKKAFTVSGRLRDLYRLESGLRNSKAVFYRNWLGEDIRLWKVTLLGFVSAEQLKVDPRQWVLGLSRSQVFEVLP